MDLFRRLQFCYRKARGGHAPVWKTTLALLGALPGSPGAVIYPPVVPGQTLTFPRDHGAHPEYRIEWWYLTGWLDEVTDGVPSHPDEPARNARAPARGFQLTFFRLRPGVQETNPSRFAPRQLLFGHAAVADPTLGRLRHAERSARVGFDLARTETADTDVRLDDWSLRREAAGRQEHYIAAANGADFAYRLRVTAVAPPLLQGTDERTAGTSQKGPDSRHSSHYYSRPQLAVTGTLTLDGRNRQVVGRAWLDHEWSSQAMPEGAVGWDWVGANLHDGGSLMAFRLRDADGKPLWAGGTLTEAGRPPRRFGPREVSFTSLRRWRSPRTGGFYAVDMRVTAGDRRFRLTPLLDDQELDARGSVGAVYWEGAVRVLQDDPSAVELGRGYLEMTGVVDRLRM